MRNPHGLFICSDADGKVTEIDSFLCSHCGLPVAVKPKQAAEDVGGFCRLCMQAICPACTAAGACAPFERRLERVEARGIARRSYGL